MESTRCAYDHLAAHADRHPVNSSGLLVTLVGLGLALLALLLLWLGRKQREALGLPAGRVVRADTGSWQVCDRPLYSPTYRLAGKPDYVVKVGRDLLPVEAKPGRRAARPYQGDMLQLGAYLLLLEEETGRRPPCGYLSYAERTFEVPYTPALKDEVIRSLAGMRRLRAARRASPQHDEPQRCLACGHRDQCDERLA